MSEIGLHRQPIAAVAANDEDADVCSAVQNCGCPLVVSHEAAPDTRVEIVRLADVEHAKRVWRRLLKDGVQARQLLEAIAKRVEFEAVRTPAPADEIERWS